MFRLVFIRSKSGLNSFVYSIRTRSRTRASDVKRPDKKLTAYEFISNEKPIKKPTNNNKTTNEVKQCSEKATAIASQHEEYEEWERKREITEKAKERGKKSIHVRYERTHTRHTHAHHNHVHGMRDKRIDERKYWKWSHRSRSWCSFCTWKLHLLHFIIIIIGGDSVERWACVNKVVNFVWNCWFAATKSTPPPPCVFVWVCLCQSLYLWPLRSAWSHAWHRYKVVNL